MLCEHYYKTLEQVGIYIYSALLVQCSCMRSLSQAAKGHQECGDGYIAPAKNEEGLYDQFEKQKLNRIPRKEIMYVVVFVWM